MVNPKQDHEPVISMFPEFRVRSLPRLWSILAGSLACAAGLHASNDNDDWSMGPVGGKFRLQPGTNYLKVQSLTAGGPGTTAGLQVGDCIYGAFGQPLGVTHTSASTGGYKGAAQDLGNAIERAESGNGILPVTVLRPGTGGVALNIALPAAGGFGPAYPLGSTKFNAMYEWASGQAHASAMAASEGNAGYNDGLFGMILLAHPSWADTSGAKPYRNSINKIRDKCVTLINAAQIAPVEATLMDGTANPAYVDSLGLENWNISTSAMFLAGYRRKTGDTSVDAACQRAADMLANRIQDYQQPPYNGTTGPTKVGLMGHGGVGGDYAHIGWTGINIINAHAMTAMAMLKGAGASVSTDKFTKSYNWMLGCTSDGTIGEGGNVGYAWKQGGYDSSGRTAGLVFAMNNFGGMDATQAGHVTRMKDYLVRHWQRWQDTHAYTVGGVVFYQFAIPYMNDREQGYLRENFKHFYQFHRNPGGTLDYFGGRGNNGGDGYLNTSNVAKMNVALAEAVASGNLPMFPAPNPARIHADFKSPWLSWPTLAARYALLNTSSTEFNVDITNYLGTVLNADDYTAAWTHVSGPATATFSDASSASTTVVFPLGGRYRIQLAVTKGGYTLTEPVDVDVFTASTPAGFVTGQANYEVYTGISGATVASLTSAAVYPDSPTSRGTVTSLVGTHTGNSYGARIRGFIIPPATGAYTFSIAADDSSQLKFGASEAAATIICFNSTYTNAYEWTKYPSQTSAVQNLTAGVPYFFEVLHKEDGGGDHLAVGWKMPGMGSTEVIDGKFIAVQGSGTLAISQQPQAQTAAAGGSATFSVQVTGAGPFLFQWRRNGVSFWPASTSPTLSLTNVGAGAAGNYDCLVTAPGGTVTSSSAVLTITGVGLLTQGGLWRDVFNNTGGATVADLTGDIRYPNFPDSGGVINTARGPSDAGDAYGDRWTGWIKPDVTGPYKFFITSDDASELWLSTTDQPAQKVKIATVSTYTAALAWSGGGKSAPINLAAGNRYYIEVRHKDSGGSDHCAVTWQKPGAATPVNNDPPIDGAFLEYLTGGVHDSVVSSTLSLVSPTSDNVTIRPGVSLALQTSASPPSTGATIAWTQESGPSTVTFSEPAALSTGASFSTEGSYVLRCTHDNGGLPSTIDVTVNVSGAVTANWVNAGIAEPRAGSGVLNSNGSVTVSGTGLDIYNASDSCHFFYKSITGDFDVRSRVASKSIATSYGQHAALMARENTAANGRNVALTHESGTTVAFQYRIGTGSSTTYNPIPSIGLPVWQRLVRSGGNPATGAAGQTFTGYYSTDNGATWIQRSSYTFATAMPDALLVGFAVSNGSASASGMLNSVVFDNISGFPTASNIGPVVSAGPDTSAAIPATAPLAGSASDDGLPAAMTRMWSKTSGPGTVTFADASAVDTTASFNSPGTYVLRLTSSDTDVTTFDETTVTVTTASDIRVAATDAIASEAGPDPGTFTFTRNGSLSGAITVNFTVSGTAANGTDHTTLPTSVVIPNGTTTATLNVLPLSDALVEGPETVIVTLAEGGYGFNTIPATVTISDTNHAPIWAASPFSAADGVANVSYSGQTLAGQGGDPDAGDSIIFSKINGPDWLAVAADGTLGGTPLSADLGPNIFIVRITDLAGLSADATLSILVRSNVKADNADSLEQGSSWVGGFAPTSNDVANWNGNHNTIGSLAAVLPGSALTWKGIALGNLSGTAAGLVSIGGTGAATASSSLNIGGNGIDMSSANQNLVINSATTVLGATQTWNVASGRNLRFGNTGTGGGNANVDGSSGTVVTVTGGGVVDANQGGGTGFTDAAGFAGYGGKWIVASGATLRGSRNGATAWGTNTAADTITLSGGTLSVGGISSFVGNWTWNTNITLTTTTTSSIDQQIATGNGRYLKLMGAMTGSGNLVFKESGTNNAFTNDDLGYIVTGANPMSGTVTIGGETENGISGRLTSMRLGGVTTSNSTNTGAGTGGDLGTASVVNNGLLTLSHSNTWTYSNPTSGNGKLRIGGAVSGANTQDVTVSGNNSYSGGTDIATGTLRVSGNNSALGSGVLNFTGSATLATANGGGARTLANAITVGSTFTATLDSNHADLTIGGLVGGAGNITTTGGVTILSGNNTYAGTTSVGAGSTLRVNGDHTGTGPVSVASGARLEGGGTLPGAVSLNGTLAPGDGVGTMTTGEVAMADASGIAWQVADWTGPPGTGHDTLVAGSVNLTGVTTAITVVLSGQSLANFTDAAKSFTLVQTTGGITGFSANKIIIDKTALPTAPGTWAVRQTGNNLELTYTPANSAPSFGGFIDGAAAAATVPHTGSIAGSAGDPNPGDTLSYSKTSGPTWLGVAADGSLSGTPGLGDGGPNTFTVRVTDGGGLFAETTLLIDVTLTPAQSWQFSQFGDDAENPLIAGDDADPDGDGLKNLLEYALGTNPKTGNTSGIVHDMASVSGKDHLRLTIHKNPAATDLTFMVETCGDFSDWSSATTIVETNTANRLVARDTVTGDRRFIRLRITR